MRFSRNLFGFALFFGQIIHSIAQTTPSGTPTPSRSPSRSPLPTALNAGFALSLFGSRTSTPLYEPGYVLMVVLFVILTFVLFSIVLYRTQNSRFVPKTPPMSLSQVNSNLTQNGNGTENLDPNDPKEIGNEGVLINPLASVTSQMRVQPPVVIATTLLKSSPLYSCPPNQRADEYLLDKVHPFFIWIGIFNIFIFIFGIVVAYAPWAIIQVPSPYSNWTMELTLFNVQMSFYDTFRYMYYFIPTSVSQAYRNRPYDRASYDSASLTTAFVFAHSYWVAAIAMIQGFVAHRAIRAKYTLIRRGRDRPTCCMNCCDCPDCCCCSCPLCVSHARCTFRLNSLILLSLLITICAGTAPFEYRNTKNLRPTGAALGFAIFCFFLSFISTALSGAALEMLLDASLQPGKFALLDLAVGGENTTIAHISSSANSQVKPITVRDNMLVFEMRSRQQSQQLQMLQRLQIQPQTIGIQNTFSNTNTMFPQGQMALMSPQQMALTIPQQGFYPQQGYPQQGFYPQILPQESYQIPSQSLMNRQQTSLSPSPARSNWQVSESIESMSTPEQQQQQSLATTSSGSPESLPSHGLSPAQFAELEARRQVARGLKAETLSMRRADTVTSARMTPEQKELYSLRSAQVKASFPPITAAAAAEISIAPTLPPRIPPDVPSKF